MLRFLLDPSLWRRSFWFPATVALLHLLITIPVNLYAIWPDVDRPMHFLGGVSVAYAAYGLLSELIRRSWIVISPPRLLHYTVIATVGLATIIWEFYEFCLNYFFGIRVQTSLHDTLIDVFLGIAGAVVYTILRVACRFRGV